VTRSASNATGSKAPSAIWLVLADALADSSGKSPERATPTCARNSRIRATAVCTSRFSRTARFTRRSRVESSRTASQARSAESAWSVTAGAAGAESAAARES
jgi:hypothetical protein